MAAIAFVRCVLFAIHRAVRSAENASHIMRDYPFTALAKTFQTSPVALDDLISNAGYSSWSSVFQHKLLINLCVTDTLMEEGTTELGKYSEITLCEMERYLREVATQTHPNEAKALLKWISGLCAMFEHGAA